ncbi:MAG: hypothetical protein AAGI37_06785 [Planctomycetota bacterium]
MLDPIFTRLEQGHRLQAVEYGLIVVNAAGETRHEILRDQDDKGWVNTAIEKLMRERRTWLEGYCAASDDIAQGKEVAA